jgi:citronellol/citronellal dehydrogenase
MGILDGRVALVTGASRGIGQAIALRLASEGATVAVSARTEEQRDERLPGTIHETVDQIKDAAGHAVAVRADLSRPEDRVRLIDEVTNHLGAPDILVNNAAVTWFLPAAEFPESKWRIMFEVQVRASFELAQLVIPGMRLRNHGWILNISSGAARHPQGPPYARRNAGTVYGMCKAAIERFSTGLAAELYDDNIAVNALSPSRVVATPGVMLHRLIPDGYAEAEPAEVMAEAALALCSGDPKIMTGRIDYSQELLAELGVPIPT